MSYAKVRRFEYRTMSYLEARGYRCIRSAGSHGPVDVVAVKETGGFLVQVKANRQLGPEERDILAAFPCPRGFEKAIHLWKDYGREPEITHVGGHVSWPVGSLGWLLSREALEAWKQVEERMTDLERARLRGMIEGVYHALAAPPDATGGGAMGRNSRPSRGFRRSP